MSEPAVDVRVAVLGCGAIGSLYAAHLARVPGVEVWAIDPWVEHVSMIERDGLHVVGQAQFTARVYARTDARELPPCDFGIVATKALHTHAAVDAARGALAAAAVVSVQNGLGNEEVVAEVVPQVIGAASSLRAWSPGPAPCGTTRRASPLSAPSNRARPPPNRSNSSPTCSPAAG